VARADLDRDVRKAEVRAKRPAPKRKAAPRGAGIVGVSTRVATRQAAPKQVVQRTQKAGRPALRGPRMPPGFDPELAAIIDEATKSAPRQQQPQRRPISAAGPDLSRLARLNNNTNTSWMGGLVQNIARGGLNVATGLPGAAQLVGENVAAFNPVVGPLRFVPGLDAVDRYQNRVAGIDKRAAESQVDWAKYTFGPLAEGDISTFGDRVYEDPVGVLSTVAAGAGAVARAGNVGARIGRMAAPQSQMAARTSRRLSDLPAKERQAIVMQENARRREIGKQPLPFEPGHGGRHRPPREVRSTVGVNEPGVPVAGEIVRQVPRKGYSYNPITRTAQRRMDAIRDRTRPGREARAQKARDIGADAGVVASARSVAAIPNTAEAKAGRSLKRDTLDKADQWDSRAEVDLNQKANGLARSLRRLKKDQNAAGIPGKERISTEEMAVTLHWQDVASARGGRSATELRAQTVRRLEGGIRERINKEARQYARKNEVSYKQARAAIERSPWVAEARAQVETVKRVPDSLLRLEGDSPDVVRVRNAVTEGRRADAENQRQSVEAGVVKAETAEAMRSRTSALLLGGSKWWQDAVRDVQRRYERKLKGLRRRRDAAAAAGDKAAVARLNRELGNTLKARRARVNQIKRSAVRETDDLKKAREEFAEAEAALRNAKSLADRTDARNARDRARKRVKDAEDFAIKSARSAVENQRRMHRRDKAAAEARRRAETRRDLGEARSKRREAPNTPSVRVAFSAGARYGRADVRAQVAPKISEKPRRVPIVPNKTDMTVTKSGKRRMEKGVNAKLKVGEARPRGITPTQGRAYFAQLSAQARHTELRRMSQSARAADRDFVRAQIDAARRNARPLSASEETALRRNLAAAEKRYAATRARPVKHSAPVQRQLQTAERLYNEAKNKRVGTPTEISAATRARDTFKKRLDKIERESLGFTKARRPELVGDSGVYIPDRLPAPLRPKKGQTGPRASRIGPDDARRSKGYLKTSAGFDMHPELMLHQAARASANYTGRISKAATAELIGTIAYKVPGSSKFLRGDSKLLSKITDPSKVAFISQAKLERALKQLDELADGKWMDEGDVRDIFADRIPEGANKSDYVAVHADSKDVWTEAMTDGNKLMRYYDTGMTYWKGGLLALSPKWYLNNTAGLALQYGVLTGGDLSAVLRGNSRVVREAIEKRAPWVAKDTLADETRGSVKVIKPIRKGFEINAKLEEFWRRSAYANRANRVLSNEGVRYRRLNSAEYAKALETMPDSAVRSIARDIDFFIGNYRKFNKFEQRVMRRVIPFYSWLRVISRLTFGMPFRSPTRLFLMNVLANASAAGLDPERYNLPVYERSAFVFGDTRIGVNAANPGATLAGFMTAPGAESSGRAAFKETQGWITPAVTAPFSWTHGMNNFGNVINPSPGTAPFGGDKEFINTVSGVSDRQSAGIPASEAFISNLLPGQVGAARKVFSGGWTPRDDATTVQLFRDYVNRQKGGKRNYALYYKKNPDSPLTALPFNPYVSAFTGANVRRLDRQKLAAKIREDNRRIKAQNKSLDKQKQQAQRP
jgi:hypothetical protein